MVAFSPVNKRIRIDIMIYLYSIIYNTNNKNNNNNDDDISSRNNNNNNNKRIYNLLVNIKFYTVNKKYTTSSKIYILWAQVKSFGN